MKRLLAGRALGVALLSVAAAVGCESLMPADSPGTTGSAKPGSGAVTRQTHQAFFPIQMGAHGNADCNSCHGGFPTFKMFSCVGCHEHQQPTADLQHAGITDYQFDSKACLTCHPNGVAGGITRADHSAKFFPIDQGTPHANGQCADCHTDPADRKVFSCIDCHDHAQGVTDPKHASIMGYRYDSPSCLRCHAGGKARFEHSTLGAVPNCVGCHREELTRAVTTPASNHTANNFPTTCETCHESFTAWGPGTPMDHQAVGGPSARCETCHLGNFTAAVAPFNHAVAKVAASACNGCHTDVTTWTKFVHTPTNCYNGATGRTHEKATCVQCHAVPTNYQQTSCTACHRDRGKSCD